MNEMFYFAPMEGVSVCALRSVHHRMFPGIDRYYTPFLTAMQTMHFKKKETRDIDPERNKGIPTAVQIMTGKAEEFVWAVRCAAEAGYQEINLNAGCPAATAVTRGRGAGILGDPDAYDAFWDRTFELLRKENIKARITVKTRIGLENAAEERRLLEIYNRYPISELIVHPRLRIDYYRNELKMDVFRRWMEESLHPVSFNGDITTASGYRRLRQECKDLASVMIGRGLLRNPALVREIQGGPCLSKDELYDYMEAVYQAHCQSGIGIINAIGRMKELWSYTSILFPDAQKGLRMLRKASHDSEYHAAVTQIFSGEMVIPEKIEAPPVKL